MKRALLLSLALAPFAANAVNLVKNGSFDAGNADWSWNGNTYWYTDGADSICSQGWWDGLSIWQDTGHAMVANAVYTYTVRSRTGDGQARGLKLSLQNVSDGWTMMAPEVTGLYPIEDKGMKPGAWREFTMTLSTVAHPELVGKTVGVGVQMITLSDWGEQGQWGWNHYDNVSLTYEAVPEPATMAVLGLGALALVRRRKSA